MPRLVKGSAEAKEFMAKIRAMRVGKKAGPRTQKQDEAIKARMAALRARKAAKKAM